LGLLPLHASCGKVLLPSLTLGVILKTNPLPMLAQSFLAKRHNLVCGSFGVQISSWSFLGRNRSKPLVEDAAAAETQRCSIITKKRLSFIEVNGGGFNTLSNDEV
jgi:hypothetical protein